MIYINKNDINKNVYRVTQDYNVKLSYFVKAKDAAEAEHLVMEHGGIKHDSEYMRNIIDENSEQIELDCFDHDYDDTTTEMLGKVIVDENDQDEVELDKYAREGI